MISKKKNRYEHYVCTIDVCFLSSVIIAGILVFLLREEPKSNHNASDLAQEYVKLKDGRKVSSKMFDVNAHLADKCH